MLELTVDPEDLGRVIGKRGATAQSIRTLLRALGTKNDARYNLKIIDNGVPPERRNYAPAQSTPPSDEAANTEEASDVVADEATKENPTDDDVLQELPKDEEEPTESDTGSDRLERTRRELKDLDDLDV